jgi:hypothetical protein
MKTKKAKGGKIGKDQQHAAGSKGSYTPHHAVKHYEGKPAK